MVWYLLAAVMIIIAVLAFNTPAIDGFNQMAKVLEQVGMVR